MSDVSSQDRSIEREENDTLDRGPFVDSLIHALVRTEVDADGQILARRASGYVVGLTGSWGLGKSSILNLLSLKLGKMDRVIVSLFNPWLFNGRDELFHGFFSELREAMGRSNVEHAQEVVVALEKYWGAIDVAAHAGAVIADLHGAAGAATTSWRKLKSHIRDHFKKPAYRSPQEERKALEKKLGKSNAAVVVLVDELDRLEDEEVRAVAQLIKAIGDIKGISYLVAYDPKRMSEALGRGDQKRGEAYLEKIVQFPIPLRSLFANDVEILIDATFRSHGLPVLKAEKEHEKKIWSELINLIKTPRDVKRLIGAHAILEAAARHEVCPFDVLGYAWIATKAPNLRAIITSHIDALVDDPSEDDMVKHMLNTMDKKTVFDVLGSEVGDMEPLLTLLFPRFAGAHAEHFDRIARRRNLIRLLYLGNPPDMVSRIQVDNIWKLTDVPSMAAALEQLYSDGILLEFLDRADDLFASLDPEQDKLFWPALASLLRRPCDWAKGPDVRLAVANDATASVLRLGLRDVKQAYRIPIIIEALIEHGDLALVPAILRKLLFANGLTKHSPKSRENPVLGPTETQAFVDREVPRYRAAIEDGTALRRLPNVEAIFVVENLNLWDNDLKSSLLKQLQGAEALATFASLIVPPGYSITKPMLDALADADTIAQRIASLRNEDWPTDAYLLSSLRRLSAAAMGQNLTFMDDDDLEIQDGASIPS